MKALLFLLLAAVAFVVWQIFFISTPTESSLSSSPATSASFGRWHTDFAKAQAAARSSNRPLLINFTGSDWCGWCVRLKDEVFSKLEFHQFVAKHLVLFEADFPKRKKPSAAIADQNERLAKQHRVRGFPTIVLLDSNGREIGQLGYLPGGPSAFIAQLEKILP